MSKKHAGTIPPKPTKGPGRPKGARGSTSVERDFKILRTYRLTMDAGEGYDAAVAAAAKAADCSIRTAKPILSNLAPTLDAARRKLIKARWEPAAIDERIRSLEQQGGPHTYQVRQISLKSANQRGEAAKLAFLKNEDDELATLKQELKTTTDPVRKAWLEENLPRLENLPAGARFTFITMTCEPTKPYPRKFHR